MPYINENYKMANLGWLYYKHYYEESVAMDVKHDENNRGMDTLANRNETILKRNFVDCNDIFSLNTRQGFSCKVYYPGLLMGSGYTHEAVFDNKDDKNEAFKIGFFFDHATGMPCLPGHSVKGALRAAFPNHNHEKYKKEKSSMIVDLLKKSNIEPEMCFSVYLEQRKISGVSYSDLCFAELLGEIIFEGHEPYRFEKNTFLYEQIPFYRKDIFHDAFITNSGKDDLFLAIDYITPHSDPLKDPNPVKFLKILPEVEFQFQFKLKDDLITKEAKEELFNRILLDFGIGAKTNVGYGQFNDHNSFTDKKEVKKKSTHTIKNPSPPPPPPVLVLPKSKPVDKLKNGDKIAGTVVDNSKGELLFNVEVEGEYTVKPFKFGISLDYKFGRKAILELANKQREKGIMMLTLKNPKFLPE